MKIERLTTLKHTDKAGWIEIESKRWARAFDIPFVQSPPPGHPVSTVNVRLSTILAATLSEDAKLPSTQVQRVLVAISMCFPDKLEAAIGKFFHGYWVKWNAEPVQIPEGISRVLGELMEDAEVKKIMDMVSRVWVWGPHEEVKLNHINCAEPDSGSEEAAVPEY